MANCGYRTGIVFDALRSNWHNTGPRPIAWSAWYPTSATAPKPDADWAELFDAGDIVPDAPLAPGGPWPVALMSHGTGGTAESLGWLARALARQGHVVLAPNHHGNTGLEPYCPEGFLCWWERAADMSHLLTALTRDSVFAEHLDTDRVSAVGFSLGGYSVMALAGARTSLNAFGRWCDEANVQDRGPREFPDAGTHVDRLLATSPAFQCSWARAGDDFADPRVARLATIAPAPTVRAFAPTSVAALTVPVVIISGGADIEAPAEHCADWLLRQNSGFARHDIGDDVGHYTFLDHPADRSLIGIEPIFTDAPNVNRTDIHQQTSKIILNHLG